MVSPQERHTRANGLFGTVGERSAVKIEALYSEYGMVLLPVGQTTTELLAIDV
jgi:hypothetical protein